MPAEMEAGSVLFYTGSVYHGGGAKVVRPDLDHRGFQRDASAAT